MCSCRSGSGRTGASPSGAHRALRLHAARLRRSLGRSYRVETRWHQTVDDLVAALEQGRIMLLHGAWQKRLSDPKDRHLALLGGMPHTMLLVGYLPSDEAWILLNPAEPWLTSRDTPHQPYLFRMTTTHLVDFWGRRFLFYPPALRHHDPGGGGSLTTGTIPEGRPAAIFSRPRKYTTRLTLDDVIHAYFRNLNTKTGSNL